MGHHVAVSDDDKRAGAALDRVAGNLVNTLVTSWLLIQGTGFTEATAMGAVVGPLGEEASFALRKLAIDGRPVAVIGSFDDTVRSWDLTAETAIGGPPTGNILAVRV